MSGEQMDQDDDDGFNLIQPTLLQQLKTILDQYPDDGQILKELIQNAEDAGASQVKFLYDKHYYGTEKLHSERLAQFQGPALYAYNNALFTKEDWKGIRMLCDSIKVKDPMKVGRFGLGFKSVFHMTDLPSILSNTRIGFIDPHEHLSDPHYRITGFSWRLNNHEEIMINKPDQFLPYKGIFECNEEVFSQGCYNGTLFRFPLRHTSSALSTTLYSEEKMQNLFTSFIADAHLVLLFLRNLESIELYAREESEDQPKRIFQAKITDDSLVLVRNKRREFYARVQPGKHMPEQVTATYPITIETEMDDNVQRYCFLVTNYCCGGEVSNHFEKLLTDEELSYLPSVGVAMAIPPRNNLPTPDIAGHVFCALPLPVQKKSMTGLPVHVNGFFALSQNRRHIKTPNANQDDRGKLTDKSLLWNCCMMEEAVPNAYAMMIKEAIGNFNVQPEAVYKAWPDTASIDQAWKRLQDPLFQLLFCENVVYSQVHGGEWLYVEDAIFDRLNENDPKELILGVLLEALKNVASLPNHVLESISEYKTDTTEITPLLVQQVLKDCPTCYRGLGRMDKLLLLKFVLKWQDSNFVDILGLELLPTANGTFTSFSSLSEAIYICSSKHPRELLPGLQHRLLDQNIGKDLLSSLEAVANQGCTQLQHLCKDHVPALLRESLPSGWLDSDKVQWHPGNENHPAKTWLKGVWDYLREHFEHDLYKLQNLPLIPLNFSKDSITLTRLASPSRVVRDDGLDHAVCDVLKALGVLIIDECPNFLISHPGVLKTFFHPPSAKGVLKAMTTSASIMGSEGMLSAIMLEKVSNDDKRALRKFIADTSSLAPLATRERKLLLCLPLFETLSKNFVAKNDGLKAAAVDAIPLTPRRELVDVKEDDSKKMASLLGIRIPTLTEFLCDEIFPDVKKGRYSEEEIDKLMAFVIERYLLHADDDTRFEEEMKGLPFVTTNSGRFRAMDLFDPRKDQLRDIFADEHVFPVGAQYTNPAALVVLEKLGLKNEKDITSQDLYQSAKKIADMSSISTMEKKSRTMMAYLNTNWMKLHEKVSGIALGELLQDILWVSALRQRPHGFPASLPFLGEIEKAANFHKPSEVKSKEKVNLIGTLKPIAEVNSSSQLANYFGWDQMPHVLDVVEHLKNVISSYTPDEKLHYMLVMEEIYSFLFGADHAVVIEALHGIRNLSWIWNGDGFSSPDVVLAEKPSIDLSPYVSFLPPEMTQYSELFLKLGMQAQCDISVLLRVLGLIKNKYDLCEQQFDAVDVERDLQLCVDILNKVKPDVGEELSPELQEKVFLPTYVEHDAYVRLAPVEECVYCEHEWLRPENDDEDKDYFFVHPNVPSSTVERLNVRTLRNSMLDPDELGVGEEFGQEEKLTRRLNRLLEDYTDGFAVPKELIQNADDAGATEVRFLYDERTNEDAMTCLIDEGMKDCQGAALWVYNNAEFQNEDFENLTKLSGATKEQDTQKIGKFGLGFNAVYNLTDVPMLVSRNYFVIFDPHTIYLGKAIRNKNKPGIKIDTNKHVKKLRNFCNQFKPFNGIFGCDLRLDKEDNSFHGTLFRFPLRTKEQAIKSEIKQLVYDCKQMKELLQLFIEGARSLLLFTQNVCRVSIFHLPRESTEQLQPKLIFEVTKSLSPEGIIRELPDSVIHPPAANTLSNEEKFFLKQCNFLRASSEAAKCTEETKTSSTVLLKSALTLNIQRTVTEDGSRFFGDLVHLPSGIETWLVASSMGNGQAMEFSQQDKSLLPSAGVAVRLLSDCALVPEPACSSNYRGSLFCYLPLPIDSGLPVHVNGAFAVDSNRRNLKAKTGDDKVCIGVEWNNVLLKDSVCAAYLNLLDDVKPSTQVSESTYQFHSLWPKFSEVKTTCEPLARSFYEHLLYGTVSLFSDGNKWVGINDVVFLDPQFRNDTRIGDMAFEVFQMLVCENKAVIDLPVDIYMSVVNYGHATTIQPNSFDKTRFFRELFFPSIDSVPSNLRDNLVLYALDEDNDELDQMIKTFECIPVSPHGQTLKSPGQLVCPNKEAALLFCPSDERFPHGSKDTFLNPLRLFKLEQLGMLTDDLYWPEVAERAESAVILNQNSSEAAVQRANNLINFLEKKLNRDGNHCLSDEDQTRILEAKFLPILKKPKAFPLIWRSDEPESENKRVLVSPLKGFLSDQMYLVCCTEPVIEAFIPPKAKAFLKLDRNQPTIKHAMHQLDEAFFTCTTTDNAVNKEIRKICTASYRFLQEALRDNETQIVKFFQEKDFILVGNEFVCVKQVAFNLSVDCSPYLYKVPDDLTRSYSTLMKVAGVRDVFEVEDFISALKGIKQDFEERKLNETTIRVAVNLATLLEESLKRCKVQFTIDDKRASIYLPNSDEVMQLVSELCINNCPWLPGDIGVQFVNPSIPTLTSFKLGVKTRREEALRHHTWGISFGQREKLTNRLKRILTAYPCEKELLKELLQNADDAQATEICFITDPRSHPKERVFEECWKPLQGPALCVYNNKPFTQADIEGIQNLGEGSKGDDPNKTGQYGVGFNAVYHLTDVPSFMSKGEEIDDVLCVFDPHCQYVPDANPQEPGRMYKETTKLREVFPDVFSCYLEEHFSIENSTMFRFPLRTQEMAHSSKLSSSPVTLQTLNEMMEALKNELFEVLLFVNNVQKITLCDIDEKSGQVVNKYSVEVVMSEEDLVKRREFSSYIKQIGKLAKDEGKLPCNIGVKKCSYVMTLKDSMSNEEKWFIVQQFGLEKPLLESIVNAYRRHDLGMLPRGGVACLLEKTTTAPRRKNKAFCFLPLPLETDLPVHVNGHFALDHEARRNLWRDETSGYRSDWNNTLLDDVIASCYLTLLDEVRKFYQLPVIPTEPNNPSCCEQDLVKRVEDFEKLFPQFDGNNSYWNTLVRSVYQGMDNKQMRLLPVIRSVSQGSDCMREVQLTWLPPTGTRKDQAFFNNLGTSDWSRKRGKQEENDLAEILIQTGFNLVRFSLSVFRAFKKSGVKPCCVSPSSVLDFFKTFSCQDPLCNIGSIPIDVGETPFKNDIGVALVLAYCKDQEHFLENLSGLPLLLTQDNILREFNWADRKFMSEYHDILSSSKEMFVHEQIRTSVFKGVANLPASVFQPFDVTAFTKYLPHTLPYPYYRSDGFVKWYPNNETEPNRRWIFRVWGFLAEVVRSGLKNNPKKRSEMSNYIRTVLHPLSNCCILPATDPGLVKEDFLVPVKLAESVLDFTSYNLTSNPLVGALRNLGLPELNCTVLCGSAVHVGTFLGWEILARQVVASPSNPASLLKSLHQSMARKPNSLQGKLNPLGCKYVLQYFSDNVSSLENAPFSKNILRKLPFYLATHGGLVSLENQDVCVLPSGIPREAMGNLESEVNVVFLESVQNLSNLYIFLEFECISSVDVYCKFILANFKVFSRNAQETHLKHIRVSLMNHLTNENGKGRLLHCLRTMAVISTSDGTLKRASCFHDPQNAVFKAMLPEDMFPPEPFNSTEWQSFMKMIGMVHEVSREHFIRFAKEVAQEGAIQRSEKTDEKSKVLVANLFNQGSDVGLLQHVCGIRFVVSSSVRDDLRVLHAQYGAREDGQTPYISFKDSVVSDHDETVWTTAHLLPRWADPRIRLGMFSTIFPSSILAHLHVLTEPTLKLVTSHCLKISHQLAKENDSKLSEDQGSTRTSVMKKIYDFLQKEGSTSNDVKEDLANAPCILVEQGKRFVYAKQVVLELYEDLEISPFLYRVPPDFGEFHKLFLHLGCSKSVEASHYAMVLQMLHDQCQSDKLNPNEIKSSLRAVKGLFEGLKQDPEENVDLPNMYLPALYPSGSCSIDTRPVTLHKSTDVIFDDAPHYQSRLENFKERFVVDLKKAELQCNSSMNYKDFIMRLPVDLRPQLLSCVVEEKFVDGDVLAVHVTFADSLKKQLSSEQFFHGILRLIRHANHENKNLVESVIACVEDRLRSIEFFGLNKIVTKLMYNGDLILGSEAEVPHFVDKVSESGKVVWKVYVDAMAEETLGKIFLTLTQVIAEACEGLLRDTVMFIPEMLRTDPSKIWSILDEMKIRQDDSYDPKMSDLLPQPGNFIPIEDHHLLNEGFEEFTPGEYVGFELDDPSLEQKVGDATFIYAIIIEEANREEGAIIYTRRYKVNVGHDKEPRIADSADLYKFHRLQLSSLNLADQQRSPTQAIDKKKIFSEITEVLEIVWRLPEKRRRKIIRRLFLQWHPEKNLENPAFCKEVFQHLQNEIARLESDEAASNQASRYEHFFDVWITRAKRHHTQRQNYREKLVRKYGSSEASDWHGLRSGIPESFCEKNPQPGEARRWFRQAEADLRAADKDLAANNPSYEWACFKCHQAAEKALKAAQYADDAYKIHAHNLIRNANRLGDSQLTIVANQLENCVVDSTRMRYPDRVCYPEIPNDVYSATMAREALDLARIILDKVRQKNSTFLVNNMLINSSSM